MVIITSRWPQRSAYAGPILWTWPLWKNCLLLQNRAICWRTWNCWSHLNPTSLNLFEITVAKGNDKEITFHVIVLAVHYTKWIGGNFITTIYLFCTNSDPCFLVCIKGHYYKNMCICKVPAYIRIFNGSHRWTNLPFIYISCIIFTYFAYFYVW